MNVFDEIFELAAEFKAVAHEGDAAAVGDDVTVELPEAQNLNMLLVKGKGGKRFRIHAVVAVREK